MAKIVRKTQKIFAENGAAIGQFGSAQAGSPVLSSDLDTIQALPAYENGWNDAVISGDKRPPLEEFNGIKYINDYQNAYLLQEGVAEYDAGTTYYIDSIVKESGTGDLYVSITDNNIGNALSDIVNWELAGNIKKLQDATQSKTGTIQIATDTEIFNKNTTKAITGEGLFNNLFFQEWTVGNSNPAPLAQLVPTGDPSNPAVIGYNLLTSYLEANESTQSNVAINFKDTAGNPQATFLDETNDKFLFPSNLQTLNTQYVDYFIRVTFDVDFASTNNGTTKFYIRLRRVVDDSIIFTLSYSQSDFGAETGVSLAGVIPTFVNSETDPFVVDGCYLDILNNSNSIGSVTLNNVSIRIFRD